MQSSSPGLFNFQYIVPVKGPEWSIYLNSDDVSGTSRTTGWGIPAHDGLSSWSAGPASQEEREHHWRVSCERNMNI